MCGRYSLTEGFFHIKTFYGIDLQDPDPSFISEHSELRKPRYNIAPTQLALAVTQLSKLDNEPSQTLTAMKWGLQPHWSDRGFFNARSETAASKPAFRDALKFRRCLIPATHYFEWKSLAPKKKQPYCFQYDPNFAEDHQLMSFAALHEPGDLSTFSLLTCEPNEVARSIHDRMPVLVHPSQFNEWLDCSSPSRLKPPQVVDLLHFLASRENTESHRLISFPVSTRINTAKFDDAELIKPVEVERTLFD